MPSFLRHTLSTWRRLKVLGPNLLFKMLLYCQISILNRNRKESIDESINTEDFHHEALRHHEEQCY